MDGSRVGTAGARVFSGIKSRARCADRHSFRFSTERDVHAACFHRAVHLFLRACVIFASPLPSSSPMCSRSASVCQRFAESRDACKSHALAFVLRTPISAHTSEDELSAFTE
eukprot:4555953-Pleurochrysis_carterae.AAC.1